MKFNFWENTLVFIWVLCLFSLTRCSTIGKVRPEYNGVDSKVQYLVKEYKELAKIQGITFKHEVTIGFKDINDGNIIGTCTFGAGWREIDLDKDYFNNSSNTSKMVLLFHELSHCYCSRKHDYGKNKEYPDLDDLRKSREFVRTKENGYYPGECPLSIMYPIILDDDCVRVHYNDYVVEMFRDCVPY